jgi:hypothetical protein
MNEKLWLLPFGEGRLDGLESVHYLVIFRAGFRTGRNAQRSPEHCSFTVIAFLQPTDCQTQQSG